MIEAKLVEKAAEPIGTISPNIHVNMITGSVRDACHWVEYCNFDGDTTYARMRAANGHPEARKVRHWNLGNENQCSPEDYAQDCLRYADTMKRADRNIELVTAASPRWLIRRNVVQIP